MLYSDMLTKELIKNIVLDQQKSYKLPSPYIKRELETTLVDKKHQEITIITGLRRIGKSTLLLYLKEKHNADYFINFDDERLARFTLEDFQLLYEVLLELYGDQQIFFFDEIQNIRGWERFVRRLYDMKKKVYITGSNANLLSAELGTHLTGRYIPHSLMPINFKEFVLFKGFQTDPQKLDTWEKVKLIKLFNEYLNIGGIPQFMLTQDKEYLKNLVQDILYRDVVSRFSIKNINALNHLVRYALSNYSRLISARKIAPFIGVKNHTTVSTYLRYLEDAYLLFTIPKYSYSLKQQYIAPRKLYVIDLALARSYGFYFSDDIGHQLENLVFLHLKGKKIGDIFYFAENSHQCDFIIHHEGKVSYAIQVAKELNSANQKRELRGLLKALKKFNLKEGTIVTFDQEDILQVEDYTIKIVPIYKWLLINHI